MADPSEHAILSRRQRIHPDALCYTVRPLGKLGMTWARRYAQHQHGAGIGRTWDTGNGPRTTDK